MIGADAIIKCLEAEGVSTVFGYPGVAICPFFNSILDSDIKTVLIRTEQNAAHAASGVARMTGRPGVCAVTSGPGATNVITGIAQQFTVDLTGNADHGDTVSKCRGERSPMQTLNLQQSYQNINRVPTDCLLAAFHRNQFPRCSHSYFLPKLHCLYGIKFYTQ